MPGRWLPLRALIAETGPVTERLRVREIDDDEGHRLVRIIRRARSLEQRGLVIITKEHTGWRGTGEYGHLIERPHGDTTTPAALSVKAGERWPKRSAMAVDVDDHWRAKRDTEFIRSGVPTAGLLVWLPENRRRWSAREAAMEGQGGGDGGPGRLRRRPRCSGQ